MVQGTAGDLHLASVTVSGQEAVVLGGQFSVSVPLLAGDNDVVVKATDLAGNTSSKTVRLSVSALPPSVAILSPAEGSEASGPVVRVQAQVTSTAAISTVTIGTGTATQSGNIWEADVPLALGDNTITVSATDANGLTGSATVHVRYKDVTQEPLAVTGVDPANDQTEVEPSLGQRTIH